jgi:hypothetical protein
MHHPREGGRTVGAEVTEQLAQITAIRVRGLVS